MTEQSRLTVRQKTVLNALIIHPEGISTRNLATELHLSVNGLSQTLGALSNKSLVVRVSGKDCNTIWTAVTPTPILSKPATPPVAITT